MKPVTVNQDNQSAMLLENNGRKSSGKRTRHINIRYFFITDRIEQGEIRVQYCPTDDMIGDFFTKPLQGAKFRKFRDIIMNCDGEKILSINVNDEKNEKNDPVTPRTYKDVVVGSQECVGDNVETVPKSVKWSDQVKQTDGDKRSNV